MTVSVHYLGAVVSKKSASSYLVPLLLNALCLQTTRANRFPAIITSRFFYTNMILESVHLINTHINTNTYTYTYTYTHTHILVYICNISIIDDFKQNKQMPKNFTCNFGFVS